MASNYQQPQYPGPYQLQPHAVQYQPLTPLTPDLKQGPVAGNRLHEAIKLWKGRVSRVRAISRVISALLDTVMFAFMAFVISVFLATRHDEALGRPIWPRDPKTWPTVMLLVASLATMAASILVALYYCCCFKRAADSWKVIVVSYGIHIALWIVVTFLYRWEKALDDLWGWSCTDIATELQERGHINVDFSKLCVIQVSHFTVHAGLSMLLLNLPDRAHHGSFPSSKPA